MANPITWQNVQGGQGMFAAGPLMQDASKSINGGMDKISGVYDQYQKDRSAENTAAYEAELAKYTTPEALKAAQDGGVLSALGQKFGIQMDAGVLKNGAKDQMAGMLSTQDLATKRITDAAAEARNAQRSTEQTTAANNANITAGLTQTGLRNQNQTAANTLAEYNSPQATDTRLNALKILGGTQGATLEQQAYTASPQGQAQTAATRKLASGETQKGLTQQAADTDYANASRVVSDGVAGVRARIASGAVDESGGNALIASLVNDMSTKHNLTTEQKLKLQASAGAANNDIVNSDVRTAEIANSAANKKTITDRAVANTPYYTEVTKSPVDQKLTVSNYIKQHFNANGWFDANPTKASTELNKYIGESIVVDGKRQQITPDIMIAALESGLMGTGVWGSREVDPKDIKGKLTEVMNRSQFKKQYAISDALTKNNFEQLMKALNPDVRGGSATGKF